MQTVKENNSWVLKEIMDLRVMWRRQNFKYTREQMARYDELLKLRKERVNYFYSIDQVWIGPSNHKKPVD
jgi:hypothetical protein